MRHSWRLLLFRNYPRSSLRTHQHHFQVHSSSLSHIRSLYSLHTFSQQSHLLDFKNNKRINLNKGPTAYNFSSDALIESENKKEPDPQCLLISDIFTKFSDVNDITKDLELNNVVVDHELVLKVLNFLECNPDVARKFFDWVLEKDSERLSSKAYNLMLKVLGFNGFVEEFWDLVEIMKKKGYGVSRGTRDKVAEKFEKDGLKSDLEKLKEVFASGSVDHSLEKIALRMSRIVRNQVWGEDVEKQIKDLNAVFSSDMVKIVLENLAMEPRKALIFFRWVEESGLFKHDERSYNAMARVLGREDCVDRFWKVVDEMRSSGYEMEVETYVKVLGRFVKRKMNKEAVDLYEFAMGGANKPSVQCCTFLLKKIVVGKELDMNLFSRVVRSFIGNDNMLTDTMLDAVLKSLMSVGRLGECNKVLNEMKEGGFVAGGNMQRKIAFRLTSAGNKDGTDEFMDNMEAAGSNLDYKALVSLIQGHCVSGDLEKASDCFQKMVDKVGVSNTGYAFDYLVNAYCNRDRALDASKLLHEYVSHNELKPWHATYKTLISKLLIQDGFTDALKLLDLMKDHGNPPFLTPFIKHVSKRGTGDDAIVFMRAMTTKKFPSTSVVLRLFEAFFKAGRHSEAQIFLSKCPHYIRNHADVLNLFYSMKAGKDTAAAAAAAAAVADKDTAAAAAV
ncbi:pentatricopeptide repeat-containing protein At3g02490, mitochondrial [Ricinus communis]|uniref:pentatricopeptide repeat-containing protein At3g02490, mitochondrial n=1 Tax=Ricinus communis TaxID=3988 RepID=UPI00201AEA09|nr:pentatricopeptide repeat-containing protein At3g02490, mitochondrial [Ricinus communis]